MKQGARFLFRPGTFFNQLQWSSHHWLILLAFTIIASVETHVGKSHVYYQVFADILVGKWGIPWNTALWLVTSLKIVVLLAGVFLLSSVVWVIGNLFGRHTSKRVLFRRLAVVFTVLLSAYTLSNLGSLSETLPLVASFLYVWSAALGFFAVREQFALTSPEALVLSVFAWLMVVSSWHFSRHAMEDIARVHLNETAAARPALTTHSRIR